MFEQHSESFKIWSAIIRINTDGKSLIMKLGPGGLNNYKGSPFTMSTHWANLTKAKEGEFILYFVSKIWKRTKELK